MFRITGSRHKVSIIRTKNKYSGCLWCIFIDNRLADTVAREKLKPTVSGSNVWPLLF